MTVLLRQNGNIRTHVLVLVVALSALVFSAHALAQQSSAKAVPEQQPSSQRAFDAGLRAFLAKDYQYAQKQWIAAAGQNHGRAMFNLGLLHEQSKLDAANQAQAYNWFRLAGKNGYTPANYHLALLLLEESPSSAQALELLKLAAAQGYVPARNRLTRFDQQLDNQNDVQGQPSAKPSGQPKSKQQLNYQGAAWIRAQPRSAWTIQLLAFGEKSKIHNFIDQHDLRANAAYFLDASGSEELYKLILGVYPSKSDAARVLANLPVQLQQHGPWLRTIASVRDIL